MVGENKENAVKLDLYYTDRFINPVKTENGIRLATIEEITAMKIDVIQRIGRKKDFWDLHEFLDFFDLPKMLSLHHLRYPYSHNRELIINNLTEFKFADDDFNPICRKGKHWAFIKDDFEEISSAIKRNRL